jgi:hypothetical protein
MNFSVSMRGDAGGDYWIQEEYYSEKLKKTIIWDYDANDYFENKDDLIAYIETTHNDIIDFEKKIKLID